MRFVLALVALALVGVGVWFALNGLESAPPSAVGPGAGATRSASANERTSPEEVAATLAASRSAAPTRDAGVVGARAAVEAKARDARSGWRGTVLDSSGRPVAGARVACRKPDGSRDRNRGQLRIEPANRAAALAETASGSDGRFWLTPPVDMKRALLEVRARGFVLFELEVLPETDEATIELGSEPDSQPGVRELGPLQLERGVILAGRVVGPSGAGVPEATVHLVESDADEVPAIFGLDVDALQEQVGGGQLTDASGHFEFAHVAPGRYELRAMQARFTRAMHRVHAPEAGQDSTDIVLALGPGATLAGRVTDLPTGFEAGTLEVSVRPGSLADSVRGAFSLDLGGMLEQAGFNRGERSVRVAEDGSFTVAGLVPETPYRVWLLEEPGQRPAELEQLGPSFGWKTCCDPIEVRSGDSGVTLAYDPGATLGFTVVDARTRMPIEQLSVDASWELDSGVTINDGLAATPSAGAYPGGVVRETHLRPRKGRGTLQLRLEALGYAAHTQAIEISAGTDIELGTIALEPVPLVQLVVVDARSGEPVEDARVVLGVGPAAQATESEGQRTISFTASVGSGPAKPAARAKQARAQTSTRSDAMGHATLSSFPGRTGVLAVSAASHAPWELELELPETGPTELSVELLRGGSVEVSAVDARERRLADVEIEHRGQGPEASLATDSSGRVVFDRLAPGGHSFRVQRDIGDGAPLISVQVDSGEPEPGWVTVEVEDGRSVDVLLVEPLRGTLFGVVTENGEPLSGARLSLIRELELADMAGGEGLETAIAAELTGQFEGLLALAGPRTQSDEHGRYRFDSVVTGKYRLRVEHAERAMPTSTDVEVREGEREQDIALTGAALRGRVVTVDGAPLSGARVTASPARDLNSQMDQSAELALAANLVGQLGGTGSRSARTDRDGRFELRGIPAGTSIAITASAAKHVDATSAAFELADGETRESDALVLIEAGSLRVELESSSGTQLPQSVSAIYLGEPASDPAAGFVRRNKVLLRNLRPGPWRVTAGERVEQVEVEAGQTLEILWIF